MVAQVQCPNCRSYHVTDSRTYLDKRTGRPLASPVLVYLVCVILGAVVGTAGGVVLFRTILDMGVDANILACSLGLVGAAVGLLMAYQGTSSNEQAAALVHSFHCNACRYIWTWQER